MAGHSETDLTKTVDILIKSGIDFRKTFLYDEEGNEGVAIWFRVGHLEFDCEGTLKNIVNW